jgi:predicted aspartyl protease
MIQGHVNSQGVPTIDVQIQGTSWIAAIDTGFNGDLEMPEVLFQVIPSIFIGSVGIQLGGGQYVEEDTYLIDFPFDGAIVPAEATFAATDEILIGTKLLRDYRLEIDFVARTVLLEKLIP